MEERRVRAPQLSRSSSQFPNPDMIRFNGFPEDYKVTDY